MPETPRVNTPLTLESAAKMVEAGLKLTLGEVPTQETARLILAQVWLETGRGKSSQNYSPGNISDSGTGTRLFWRPTWFEVTSTSSTRDQHLHREMLAGRAPRAFRAYSSFEEGFADYFNTLKKQFPTLLAAARSGNAQTFANAVKSSKYCPDCEPTKTSGTFKAFVNEFEQKGLFSSLPKAYGAVLPWPEQLSDLPACFYTGPSALPELIVGSRGAAVVLWQMLIGVLPDGQFGVKTAQATREWHRLHNCSQERVTVQSWAQALLTLKR